MGLGELGAPHTYSSLRGVEQNTASDRRAEQRLPMKLIIKPTSTGSAKFAVDCEETTTILELKEKIVPTADSPIDTLRLIYKGQVLKDTQTVGSYGLQDEHVVHLVKSRAVPAGSLPRLARHEDHLRCSPS